MLLVRRTLCLAAIGVATVSCSNPTSPRIPVATVLVQTDALLGALVPAGSVTWLQFTAPVSVHNAGRASITWVDCATTVEAPNGAAWETVWSPVCALASPGGLEIPAGETREVAVRVDAAVAGPGGPVWGRQTIPGTYRFTAGLQYDGVGGRIPMIASNTFTLTVE